MSNRIDGGGAIVEREKYAFWQFNNVVGGSDLLGVMLLWTVVKQGHWNHITMCSFESLVLSILRSISPRKLSDRNDKCEMRFSWHFCSSWSLKLCIVSWLELELRDKQSVTSFNFPVRATCKCQQIKASSMDNFKFCLYQLWLPFLLLVSIKCLYLFFWFSAKSSTERKYFMGGKAWGNEMSKQLVLYSVYEPRVSSRINIWYIYDLIPLLSLNLIYFYCVSFWIDCCSYISLRCRFEWEKTYWSSIFVRSESFDKFIYILTRY